MNSKDLIQRSRVAEASNTPPGVTTGGGAPDPEEFDASAYRESERPDRPRRVGPAGPAGPRPGGSRNDASLLKDTLLLVLASRSEQDKAIAQKLMAGKMPDPGEIQHILDEAGPLAGDLPEPMQKGLAAIYQRLQGGGV